MFLRGFSIFLIFSKVFLRFFLKKKGCFIFLVFSCFFFFFEKFFFKKFFQFF